MTEPVQALRVREPIAYDGSQMAAHWARRRFGLSGDCLVLFTGSCDVTPEHMIDLEDRLAGARIASPLMLHAIVEHFDPDLERAILRQRLLVAIARDAVEERAGRRLRRVDSDLYCGPDKLTVSIASVGPVSAKVHLGINIEEPVDVGVPTVGLRRLGVDPDAVAAALAERYPEEIRSVGVDRAKVRPLG
jgi:hypothetical protein